MSGVPVQETYTAILKWGLIQQNRDERCEMVRDEVTGDDDLLSQMSHIDLYEGERFNCQKHWSVGVV
jgi:hypothetical protein